MKEWHSVQLTDTIVMPVALLPSSRRHPLMVVIVVSTCGWVHRRAGRAGMMPTHFTRCLVSTGSLVEENITRSLRGLPDPKGCIITRNFMVIFLVGAVHTSPLGVWGLDNLAF